MAGIVLGVKCTEAHIGFTFPTHLGDCVFLPTKLLLMWEDGPVPWTSGVPHSRLVPRCKAMDCPLVEVALSV